MSDQDQPIIIKKIVKGGHGAHGGAWKVAYADFVTAMMALFIVLWILGQSDEVKEAVAGYFNDPAGFGTGSGPTLIEGNPNTNIGPDIMTSIKMKEVEKRRLNDLAEDIKEDLEKGEAFKNLDENQIEFMVVDEGLRIELMESSTEAFFELSTANLNRNAKEVLTVMGNQLAELNNRIIIEGHTDARKFPGPATGYTNYELSADRANAARRQLILSGVYPDRIAAIRGLADKELKNVDDPFDSANRRISIIVKFTNFK